MGAKIERKGKMKIQVVGITQKGRFKFTEAVYSIRVFGFERWFVTSNTRNTKRDDSFRHDEELPKKAFQKMVIKGAICSIEEDPVEFDSIADMRKALPSLQLEPFRLLLIYGVGDTRWSLVYSHKGKLYEVDHMGADRKPHETHTIDGGRLRYLIYLAKQNPRHMILVRRRCSFTTIEELYQAIPRLVV